MSDESRSGIGRKTKPDPSDSNSVELLILIPTPFYYLH